MGRLHRRWHTLATLVVCLAVTAGCDARPVSGPGDVGLDTPGSDVREPPSADPVVGRCGPVQVRLSDYDEALRRMTLTAPENRLEAGALPRSLRSSPAFRQATVNELIDIRIARREARARKIEVSDREIDAFVVTDPQLKELAANPTVLAERLSTRRLTLAEFRAVARERAMAQKLSEALVEPLDNEALWKAFEAERNRVVLRYVAIPNTPSTEEIDEAILRDRDRIETEYLSKPSRFRVPASRRVQIIERALPPGSPDTGELRESLDKARVQLTGGAEFATLAAELSDHPSAASGGLLGTVTRRQLPEAFAQPVGEVSAVQQGARGLFILRATEEFSAHTRPLTDGVRREIAARLLKAQGPTARAMAVAKPLITLWSRKAASPAEETTLLAPDLLKVERTTPFLPSTSGEGFIGGIGRAPEIVKIATAMRRVGAVHPEPVLFGGKLYVLKLDSRTVATRSAFNAQREDFARHVRQRRLRNAIPHLTRRYRKAHPPSFDMTPFERGHGKKTPEVSGRP